MHDSIPTYACGAVISPDGRVLTTIVRDRQSEPAHIEISKEVFVPKHNLCFDELEYEFKKTLGIDLIIGKKVLYLEREEIIYESKLFGKRRIAMLIFKINAMCTIKSTVNDRITFKLMTLKNIIDEIDNKKVKLSSCGMYMLKNLIKFKGKNC